MDALDAHAKPPAEIKRVYKVFQKLDKASSNSHPDLVDLDRDHLHSSVRETSILDLPADLRQVFTEFLGGDGSTAEDVSSPQVFEVSNVPGLYIYPHLLPQDVQLGLLDKMLLRDLCNPDHKTNVHMHYHVPYPALPHSYFDAPSSTLLFSPRSPAIHKSVTTAQYLTRKLRWMTLGGQYDWTRKLYPAGPPPAFPADFKQLIEPIFPMKAEAAIVNIYLPGDTLSLHRDVSEECNQPLVSISLGCDGLFIAGLGDDGEDDEARVAVMRLRSGDAVLMSGEARYAWHGVPKIVEGSCPEWMADWPGTGVDGEEGGRFEQWKGWMAGKRINLNVRQMFD